MKQKSVGLKKGKITIWFVTLTDNAGNIRRDIRVIKDKGDMCAEILGVKIDVTEKFGNQYYQDMQKDGYKPIGTYEVEV